MPLKNVYPQCIRYFQRHVSRKGRKVIWLLLFLSVLSSFPTFQSQAKEHPLLEIVEVVWTDEVVDRQYQTAYTETYSERAPKKPLFLWIRVKGYQQAYDRIKKTGKISFLHKWYGYLGTTAIQFDSIDVGIGHAPLTPQELQDIDWEFQHFGYFDWRTWSRKKNLAPYLWQVEVVYPDGTALPDKKQASHQTTYEIEVSE